VNAALAAGVKKLLHVSSTAALGRSHQGISITEDAVWKTSKNNSVYALSKYLAEREVWRGTQEGLPAVIVNPSVIIGTGNWQQGTPRLFHACRRGMPVYPKGANAFVFVDDVVNCMMHLMNGAFESERYILSSENMAYKDFFTLVTKALDTSQPQFALPEWLTGLTWRVAALLHKTFGVYPLLTRETARTVSGKNFYSNEKIKRALNYEFVPAHDFVTRTARAYKDYLRGS
jgi:dihydroflavonol-4-reductase